MSFAEAGVYQATLIVTDVYGCTDTAFIEFMVNESSTFYMPNTFTPDADGINDFFGPSGIGINPDYYDFYVFNRWGEQLYHTSNLNQRWDGTYRGRIVPQGVYTWLVIYKEMGFEKLLKKAGHVNVLN